MRSASQAPSTSVLAMLPRRTQGRRGCRRFLIRTSVLMVSVMSGLGCEEPTGIVATDIVGEWEAIRIEMTSLADTTIQVELVARGWSQSLSLTDDERFTLIIETQWGTSTLSGTAVIKPDSLILEAGGSNLAGAISLSGDLLTFTIGDQEFDFGDLDTGIGDDAGETARWITLYRRS